MPTDLLTRPKDDYAEVIDRISIADSPVGIDAQLTHAIIIEYLRRIDERLDRVEARLDQMHGPPASE